MYTLLAGWAWNAARTPWKRPWHANAFFIALCFNIARRGKFNSLVSSSGLLSLGTLDSRRWHVQHPLFLPFFYADLLLLNYHLVLTITPELRTYFSAFYLAKSMVSDWMILSLVPYCGDAKLLSLFYSLPSSLYLYISWLFSSLSLALSVLLCG